MVLVRVNDGMLEGEKVRNEINGSQYYSFKCIPYALPPIGDLRFKAPQTPKPWKGVRSAKEFGPVCFQYNVLVHDIVGSEDCLYLNVYSPDLSPKVPLPVMVWIHGGGFLWGSGNDDMYGPELLVSNEVILVTFNYRLHALGFLCLDTEEIPGNAGMKDQVTALRWVKQNINMFGGDSGNITIFGESAGAASVSYHLISPMSKGLFQRAIAQSGAASNSWAQQFEPREKALKLAKQVGCESEDDKVLSIFFKSVPIEALLNKDLTVILGPKLYGIDFAISDEKKFGNNERFFYGDIMDAMKNNTHEGIDIFAGYANDEGLIALTVPGTLEKIIAQAENYLESFVPAIIKTHCPIKKQLEAGRKIKKFYFGDGKVSENINQLHKFLNWDMFVNEIILMGKISANTRKNKVYFYKFTCRTERNVYTLLGLKDIIGDKEVTCHADDITYLFTNKIPNQKLNIDSDTFKIVNRVVKLWTNFSKYGNPTPDDSLGVKWSPFTVEKQDYMEIGNELTAKVAPDVEEAQFWESIFKEFYPHYTVDG